MNFSVFLAFFVTYFCKTYTQHLNDVGASLERIVGGSNVARSSTELNFVAYLSSTGTRGDYAGPICGASIIHRKVVLTAAHCVHDVSHDLFVIAGQKGVFLNHREDYQARRVNKILCHEHFNEGFYLNNDIALLILDEELEMSENVGTIALLPEDDKVVYKTGAVAGWGQDSPHSKHSASLKMATLKYVKREECKNRYSSTVGKSMLCFGDRENNVCSGDSGSALFVQKQRTFYQLGVVCGVDSKCPGNALHPGLFTDVRKYADWIGHKMGANGIRWN